MTNGHCFEALTVGQTAGLARTLTGAEIPLYAAVDRGSYKTHPGAEAMRKATSGQRTVGRMLADGRILGVPATLRDPAAFEREASMRVLSRG